MRRPLKSHLFQRFTIKSTITKVATRLRPEFGMAVSAAPLTPLITSWLCKRSSQTKDLPAAFAGALVGVQHVGRRWDQEYLLKATRACDYALESHRDDEK